MVKKRKFTLVAVFSLTRLLTGFFVTILLLPFDLFRDLVGFNAGISSVIDGIFGGKTGVFSFRCIVFSRFRQVYRLTSPVSISDRNPIFLIIYFPVPSSVSWLETKATDGLGLLYSFFLEVIISS